ncbi:MAG: hypothetical protein KAJ19_05660, partial [Gammaproteobacteria bacterium]|nr:hypothetical protein [Gammaproteobacteria bacterium]
SYTEMTLPDKVCRRCMVSGSRASVLFSAVSSPARMAEFSVGNLLVTGIQVLDYLHFEFIF